MSEDARKNLSPAMTREERLAAKLRENLRRRKAQGRAITAIITDSSATPPLPNSSGEG